MPAHDGDMFALRLGLTPKLVVVEAAVSPHAQMRGLSGREKLPAGTGLLFIFEGLGEQSMWMPDMKFALDIIWLDENLTVVNLSKGCPPCESADPAQCPKYSSGQMVKYAIEMTAGQADDYGFFPGLQLSVANEVGFAPRRV